MTVYNDSVLFRLDAIEHNENMMDISERAINFISKKAVGQEAQIAWREINLLQAAQSQRLAEQLRLILEPKRASALKGDYRTGKRLNMRKIIPYIASQFQKDRIWLRRTKVIMILGWGIKIWNFSISSNVKNRAFSIYFPA